MDEEMDKYRTADDDDSSNGPPPPPPNRPPPSLNGDDPNNNDASLLLLHRPRSPSTLSHILNNDEASESAGSLEVVRPLENITTTPDVISAKDEVVAVAAEAPAVVVNHVETEEQSDEGRELTIEVTPEGVVTDKGTERRRKRRGLGFMGNSNKKNSNKSNNNNIGAIADPTAILDKPLVRSRKTMFYSGLILLVVVGVIAALGAGFGTGAFTHGRTSGSTAAEQANTPPAAPTAPTTTNAAAPTKPTVAKPSVVSRPTVPLAPAPAPTAPTAPAPTAPAPTATSIPAGGITAFPTGSVATSPTSTTSSPSATTTATRAQAITNYLTTLGSQYGVNSRVTTQAIEWLVSSDPLQLTLSTTTQTRRLEQRYALLTLWYSSTSNWNHEYNWLNTTSECYWYGVICSSSSSRRRLRTLSSSSSSSAVFSAVTDIQMANNNVHGPLPPAWGLLTSLTSIILTNNSFTGPVPSSWSALTSLTALSLELNQLNGTLPIPIVSSNMPLMTLLHLSANPWEAGPIPTQLYQLTGLVELSLYGTQITGTLSDAISNLAALQLLDVSSNAVVGSLPSTIGALSLLRK